MAPGTKLGRYLISGELGRGSTCLVYRARDEVLDADVAVKVLADNLATDNDVRGRFVEEAQLLRRRPSPDLVAIHDVGETDDHQPFLILEMATGGSLAERISANVSDAEVRELVDFLYRSLSHLHRQNVIHRDLKPSNILITGTPIGDVGVGVLVDGERYVLSDLGLAKDLESGSSFTMGAGSVGFSAPEQTRGFTRITTAADIYGASAVVAWFAGGEAAGRLAPAQRVDSIDNSALRDALRSGLSEDPDDRPSLDQWHRRLSKALEYNARELPSENPASGRPALRHLVAAAAVAVVVGFGAAQLSGTSASSGPDTAVEVLAATAVPDPEPVMVAVDPPMVSNPAGIEVDAVSLTRYGDRTEFAMQVRFTVDPDSVDAAWGFTSRLDTQPAGLNVSGITLFDHKAAQAHFPQRDENHRCVCTIIDPRTVQRDAVQTWTATFDPVDADAVVTVGMPHFATLTFTDTTTVERAEPIPLPNGPRRSGYANETLESVAVSTFGNGTVLELHLQNNDFDTSRRLRTRLARIDHTILADSVNAGTSSGVMIIGESEPTRPLRPKHNGPVCVCPAISDIVDVGEPIVSHLYFDALPDGPVAIAVPAFGTIIYDDGQLIEPQVQELGEPLANLVTPTMEATGIVVQPIGDSTLVELHVTNTGDVSDGLSYDAMPQDPTIESFAFSGLTVGLEGSPVPIRVATLADSMCICGKPDDIDHSGTGRWFALVNTSISTGAATLEIPNFGSVDLVDGRVAT